MDRIEKYIMRFFRTTKMNKYYNMGVLEWKFFSEKARTNPIEATKTSFFYGYAKGYRAATNELKKDCVVALPNERMCVDGR